MTVTKLERFRDPSFLKQIGRPLLEQLLERFTGELAGRNVVVPPRGAHDQEFFNLFAHLMMSPEGLPDGLNDAIHAINELATPEGLQRIQQTAEQSGTRLDLDGECSHSDAALRVWLAQPALLARARNAHRLARLSTFHHFGCVCRVAEAPPDTKLMDVSTLETRCDLWFAKHCRGRYTTKIEVYVLPLKGGASGACEYWFLIRHGCTFAHTPKVERGTIEVMHFRPAKDDVVVFNPRRGEIRINARTLGERDLYRAAFGEHIYGSAEAFSQRKTYTLDPLREDGEDALDTRTIPGLNRVILRGVEVFHGGACATRIISTATDAFAAVRCGALSESVFKPGELVQAWFDLWFDGVRGPRSMQIRPPNTLRLPRAADAQLVEQWLSQKCFRIGAPESLLEQGGGSCN